MNMPRIGKIVLWFNGGDRANGGNPAIVTDTTHNAIRCNVFQPGNSGCRATNWVRHIDDPWNKDHRVARDEHGAWDWLDQDDEGLPELLTYDEIVDLPPARDFAEAVESEAPPVRKRQKVGK